MYYALNASSFTNYFPGRNCLAEVRNITAVRKIMSKATESRPRSKCRGKYSQNHLNVMYEPLVVRSKWSQLHKFKCKAFVWRKLL